MYLMVKVKVPHCIKLIFPMHTRKFVKFSVPPDRRERWPEMGSERVLRGESDMMMRN